MIRTTLAVIAWPFALFALAIGLEWAGSKITGDP